MNLRCSSGGSIGRHGAAALVPASAHRNPERDQRSKTVATDSILPGPIRLDWSQVGYFPITASTARKYQLEGIRKRFEPFPPRPGTSAGHRDLPCPFAHRGIGTADARNPASAPQDRLASSRRSSSFPIRCRLRWTMDANADAHRPLHNRLLMLLGGRTSEPRDAARPASRSQPRILST